MENEVEGWRVPTLRGAGPDPTMLGIEPGHAGICLVIGMVAWIASRMAGFGLVSILIGFGVCGLLLIAAKAMHAIDRYWFKNLTFARYPNERYSAE